MDNHGYVLAPVPVAPVNETDMVLFPEDLKALKRVAKEVGVDLRGAYLNLDGGFDAARNRKCIFNAGLIPNIKENPRNRKVTKRGRKRLFSATIHALRLRVERTLTVFGTPSRYTFCLTENMSAHPWESLAVSKGYPPDANVITMAMVESPRLCFDDVSASPERLLTGIADSMTAMGSWNMHARSDMVVAMGPQHADICARAGWSRADVHRHLCARAGRKVRDLKGGGNWRHERALAFPIEVDPDNDDCFIPALKHPDDLQLIVAGGWGPCTAVCHGWSGGSRAVHGVYAI